MQSHSASYPISANTDVLTGEAAANNVNWSNLLGAESSHVLEDRDIGPVLSQDGSAIGINFAEGCCSHSCSFKSKAESSYAAE
jgi:hypothetical protein